MAFAGTIAALTALAVFQGLFNGLLRAVNLVMDQAAHAEQWNKDTE